LKAAVREQVEFYFGDDNYPQDTFLLGQVDADRWVSLEVITQFNKMKNLKIQNACEFVCNCLLISAVVEVSSEEGRIRKRCNT